MNKREYCESRESIAYYSGLNGLEIKGIEYGIDGGIVSDMRINADSVENAHRNNRNAPRRYYPGI